ncbi:exopolysaccharide biosynthesis protein [Gilvimarinus agarilyticus]|uniref:exopolysaccharide biosynthesis protein n=2 Tax=unclassified Gilvimarinus TaxID=2642066 RepID=UPI001C09A41E|nr:exopolysaccharide biosynthesis protein [Gilvimarinus sp. 1_MG-2023]MBU2885507.1 exopolysaccharide biosynthesis protein [Gilvimarinus agarilyticus]MDO6570406.1 exopolysaccharide biosynthesis protein [Gilvimarinus sp. 2_MG-2023]MDO6748412.1 exopolysaccharide biosynthesis protein [Gilvimarinus sp. 1_MG-2023]
MMANTQQGGLTQTIDLILGASSQNSFSVGDVLESASHRGFGPMLLVPALVTFLPTGGIPGVPIVAAIVIILIAGQILLGRNTPWLPKRLRKIEVERSSVDKVLRPAKRYTTPVDRVLKPRLGFLLGAVGIKVTALLCIGLALALIPLGPIPFAAAIPSGIMVLLALGIVAKDGLLIVIGGVLSVLAVALMAF